jgi:hypothetical protein
MKHLVYLVCCFKNINIIFPLKNNVQYHQLVAISSKNPSQVADGTMESFNANNSAGIFS